MKKTILYFSSIMLLLISCNKNDNGSDNQQQEPPPPPVPENVISIESSLTIDGKPIKYTLDSKLEISDKSLRAGDGSTGKQPTETTIVLSSIGLSDEELSKGKIISGEELKSKWGVQLYTPDPLALYLSRAYTGSAQGKITVTDYDEYENADGVTKTGKVSLQFDGVKVQDQPGVKTVDGVITIEKYIYSNNTGNGNNALVGKWANKAGCKNKNGEYSYFLFSANGSGDFFNSDCNSACAGYGIMFHFNYTVSGNTLKLNFTKTDDYCGRSVDTPSPEDVPYTLSGNTLTMNGVSYTKI